MEILFAAIILLSIYRIDLKLDDLNQRLDKLKPELYKTAYKLKKLKP